jgi:hypothetical protein
MLNTEDEYCQKIKVEKAKSRRTKRKILRDGKWQHASQHEKMLWIELYLDKIHRPKYKIRYK